MSLNAATMKLAARRKSFVVSHRDEYKELQEATEMLAQKKKLNPGLVLSDDSMAQHTGSGAFRGASDGNAVVYVNGSPDPVAIISN